MITVYSTTPPTQSVELYFGKGEHSTLRHGGTNVRCSVTLAFEGEFGFVGTSDLRLIEKALARFDLKPSMKVVEIGEQSVMLTIDKYVIGCMLV